MLAVLLLLQTASWVVHDVQARLSIVSSSQDSVLVRSGEKAMLWCETSQPWFLCVWKGPNGLAITKTQNQECNGSTDTRMKVTGRGSRCELDLNDVQVADGGQYSCVMADQRDVVTVSKNIFLNVGVSSTVRWVQGNVVHYNPGGEISLTCESTPGNPRPSLVIRSEAVSLSEKVQPSSSDSSVVSRTVSVDSANVQNNTEVTCHAEQRDELTGRLVYNSSVVLVRMEETIIPLPIMECVDWWCEYQIFLFIMLVMVVLIIISCCGMYFFFATRGKPYNIIMYNSEHGTWNRDDNVQEVKERLVERKDNSNNPPAMNNSFGLRADIIRTNENLNQSLYSQVDKTKKSSKVNSEQKKAPVLETDLDNTFKNDDSIMQRIVTDFDTTNESSSFLSKDNITASNDTTLQDNSKLDISAELEEELKNLSATEEEKRKMLVTMMEEEIMYNNTETTLEMIYKKYGRKNRSQTTLEDEDFDDEFTAETELKKYALHKYRLENLKNVKRLGRTYSKVVRDHLSNNPKLAVSESAVEIEVARPSSRLSFCNRSNASTPVPSSRIGTPSTENLK